MKAQKANMGLATPNGLTTASAIGHALMKRTSTTVEIAASGNRKETVGAIPNATLNGTSGINGIALILELNVRLNTRTCRNAADVDLVE